ncbi:MAG TPA: SBBP repeat-containing protein, partial [candidate division Zixibacteria bacterium]
STADNGTNRDYATVKYDSRGKQLWVKRYNGPENKLDEPSAIAIDRFGNAYVTGKSMNKGIDRDYATIKYYPNGDTAWIRRHQGPTLDEASAIAVDGFGNVYVTGESYDARTNWDYLTIKYDSSGNELWTRRYNGTGNRSDSPSAIAVDSSGNIYVTGTSQGPLKKHEEEYIDKGDYLTIKYDSNGKQLWVKRYNGPEDSYDGACAMAVDNFGNVYVTGESEGGWESLTDYLTIKYSSSGKQLWIRKFGGPRWDRASDIAIDDSGNAYVTGEHGISEARQYIATIKYDRNGKQLWKEIYNYPGKRYIMPSAITVDGSGNIYVTGGVEESIEDRLHHKEVLFDYITIKYFKAKR